MQKPIALFRTVTAETFDEAEYLASNPDVRSAVASGVFASGRYHFQAFGHNEARRVRANVGAIREMRRAKLERLRPLLREDMPFEERDLVLDFLTPELRAESKIVDTENVSSNGYDRDTRDLVDSCDGLVLDCGAGRRDHYYGNVVNYEIVAYDTTDVIGVGEELPFKDDSFDAVISISVLEHVQDPFRCAKEISRVLRPGGSLFCVVPFLQPLHGYPHHYFNATIQGIQRLFERELSIDRVYVPPAAHPAHSLHWILQLWCKGLESENRKTFESMRISDIVSGRAADLANGPGGALAQQQIDELASGFVVRARKA